MKGLTVKQQNILNFITEFENKEGMAPTVYEIANHSGIKTSTVFAHLRALKQKGKISRSSKARSLKVIKANSKTNTFLSAGTAPLENTYRETGEYYLDKSQAELEPHFAFRIPDNSMSDFGIYSEDVVIVHIDQEPKPGDLTVIKMDSKTVLRCFYPTSNSRIELRPANPAYQSQICNPADIKIRGVVTGLQRKY